MVARLSIKLTRPPAAGVRIRGPVRARGGAAQGRGGEARARYDSAALLVRIGPCALGGSGAGPRGGKRAPGTIRTYDLRFRRPTLYPAELRALGGARHTTRARSVKAARGANAGRGAQILAGGISTMTAVPGRALAEARGSSGRRWPNGIFLGETAGLRADRASLREWPRAGTFRAFDPVRRFWRHLLETRFA